MIAMPLSRDCLRLLMLFATERSSRMCELYIFLKFSFFVILIVELPVEPNKQDSINCLVLRRVATPVSVADVTRR